MAIYNNPNLMSKMKLQPGARGEMFDGNRINRTNYTLNTSEHVATNSKYGMDDRLPVEFRYGYAQGFNQMLITKGRIVAIDPYLNIFDADTQKYDNALTLANGGVDVVFNDATKQWESTSTPFVLDPATGKDTTRPETCRPANMPIGVLIRNEYTRDIDAFNGITPGAVNTNCMTELPWFIDGAKAKSNPWGSAYGSLKPGDLVKADSTGRVTLSPLSDPTWLTNVARTAGEIELERQQVIGQIYEVRKELIPMGAAKYAQWALSDILEFEEFNPDLKRKTNRRGEDHIEKTPYPVDGKGVLPYESTFTEHDLHMMNFGNERQNYNRRMQHKYRFDFGIPGLTDGYNAIVKETKGQKVGDIPETLEPGRVMTFRALDTNIEKGSLKINGVAAKLGAAVGTTKIVYFDELQGMIQLEVVTKGALEVKLDYNKRGEAGVPTHLDWDGCVGVVKVLLQK